MNVSNKQYWQSRYLENSTGWDLGAPSTPLKEYLDQLTYKNLKILIPGAGNAYEAEYLHKLGFKRVYVVDWAEKAINNIQERIPNFPKCRLLCQDFFQIKNKFDIILEQTFFCALTPELRPAYVDKMYDLLHPGGKLVGLFFQIPFQKDQPPFGGNMEEYKSLFKDKFNIRVMETATNSIEPRKGNELFFIMSKK